MSRRGHPGNQSKIHSLNWYSILLLRTYRFKNDTKEVNPNPNNLLNRFAEKTVTNCKSNPAELHSNYYITIKEIEHRSHTSTIIAMKLRRMNSKNLSRFHKFSGNNFKKKITEIEIQLRSFLQSSQIQIQKII